MIMGKSVSGMEDGGLFRINIFHEKTSHIFTYILLKFWLQGVFQRRNAYVMLELDPKEKVTILVGKPPQSSKIR